MKKILMAAVVALMPLGALAQSQTDIAQTCVANLDNNLEQDSEQLVQEILSWGRVSHLLTRSIGAACLSGLTLEGLV